MTWSEGRNPFLPRQYAYDQYKKFGGMTNRLVNLLGDLPLSNPTQMFVNFFFY
jgi:hypothetical protein